MENNKQGVTRRFVNDATFWPEDGSSPSLASFIEPESWLLFQSLQWDQLGWLSEHFNTLYQHQGYVEFKWFVTSLTCVNKPSKRMVKPAKYAIGSARTESDLQNTLAVAADHRKKAGFNRDGKFSFKQE